MELLQTCYSDIQKTADQRRKELKKFNDKYLLDTIKDALNSRDITSIESGIEDIIIENFSNLNVIDQAKLKSYVLDTLKKHKEEQTEKNSEDSERYSRTEKHGVTFKKDVSPLSLFKDTLGNEKIMRGVIDRIGCRIISTQHTLNKNTLKSVKEGISGVKIQDVKYEKNDIKKESVKEKDTSENSLLKEKIKRLDGIISGQIDNFNSSTSLFSIFDSSRRYRKYGFVKQRLRNIKALKTKLKRKIGFKINSILGRKIEKKTLKKRFLEQYNDITLRKLYYRISEFDKATILSKPKKKSILLTLGYGVKSFVTWAVKGIFGVIKTTIKGIWNVTKKIFGLIKTGVTSLISRIKIFLMTPAGAYIVGFVAGLVWFKLIKPVVDWVKDKIKKLLKLMGYESLDELKADKDKILKDLRVKYSNFINNNGIGIRQADKFLGDMELLAAKLDNFEAKIQTFKENTTGKVMNTACTTVGVIVGSFFGPIGGLIGGALGKAVGMTAEYFYKRIPDGTEKTTEKNLILRDIRERYN